MIKRHFSRDTISDALTTIAPLGNPKKKKKEEARD